MAIFLSVRVGPNPNDSYPVMTVSDERIITALLGELKALLDDENVPVWVPRARPAPDSAPAPVVGRRTRRSSARAVVVPAQGPVV
jgi:hypothetical protein